MVGASTGAEDTKRKMEKYILEWTMISLTACFGLSSDIPRNLGTFSEPRTNLSRHIRQKQHRLVSLIACFSEYSSWDFSFIISSIAGFAAMSNNRSGLRTRTENRWEDKRGWKRSLAGKYLLYCTLLDIKTRFEVDPARRALWAARDQPRTLFIWPA